MLKSVPPHHVAEVMAIAVVMTVSISISVSIAVRFGDWEWDFPLASTEIARKQKNVVFSFFAKFEFMPIFSYETTSIFKALGADMTVKDELTLPVGDGESDPWTKKRNEAIGSRIP